MSEIDDLFHRIMLQVWSNQNALTELDEVIFGGDEAAKIAGVALAIHGQTSIGLPGLDVLQLGA